LELELAYRAGGMHAAALIEDAPVTAARAALAQDRDKCGERGKHVEGLWLTAGPCPVAVAGLLYGRGRKAEVGDQGANLCQGQSGAQGIVEHFLLVSVGVASVQLHQLAN